MGKRQPLVLLDDARVAGASDARLYENPAEVFVARRPEQVASVLAAADAARRGRGGTLAGYLAYEAGLALEDRLAPLAPPRTGAGGPLVWLGRFEHHRTIPEAEMPALLSELGEGAASLGPLDPQISLAAYAEAFDALQEAIAAGEIYQANLTFPLTGGFTGDPLTLYAALRPAARAGDDPHAGARGARGVRGAGAAGSRPRRAAAGRSLVTGSLVSPETRQRIRDLARPIALGLGRLGLTPNALTVLGFAIAVVAAIAAAAGAWLAAGLLVLFGGVFDLFDGALARATGRASRLGAFMDSVFDRWGEGVVYVGIMWGTLSLGLWRPTILAAAAMTAAFMVSYARAKSESLGFTSGTGMASIGMAPREVRIGILTLGLVAAGILPGLPPDTSQPGGAAYPWQAIALEAALGLIAILSTITTIQRIVHVIRQQQTQEQR